MTVLDTSPQALYEKLPKWAKQIVSDVYYDSDGYWANLKDGFNFDGSSACHSRESWKRLLVDLRDVEEGEPY